MIRESKIRENIYSFRSALKDRSDIVIIGGGIVGLAIAYNLARKGKRSVQLLERSYIGSGASTRNAEHVGTNFSVKENVLLSRESLRIWRRLSSELGFNTLFSKQTEFHLAYDEDHVRRLTTALDYHRDVGLRSKFMSATELKAMMPFLNVDGVSTVAAFQSDSTAHHDAVIWGYARKAFELGVGINTYAPALNIRMKNGNVDSVITSNGPIRTSLVINAAGAWSKQVASWVGIDLPTVSRRREIMVTEPLKHFLEHSISCMKSGVYFHQTLRGEVIGAGIQGKLTTTSFDNTSSAYFIKKYARNIVDIFPALAHVNLMRQWAGLRDETIDNNPIIGWVDEVGGFYQANAFHGNGFGLGPIMGKLIAEDILDGRSSLPLDRFDLNRFKEGRLIHEAAH